MADGNPTTLGCALCKTPGVPVKAMLGGRVWACAPCAKDLSEWLAADVRRDRPIVTEVARLCPKCHGESDPEHAVIFGVFWAAQALGLRLRFDGPDRLRAERDVAVRGVRLMEAFIGLLDDDFRDDEDESWLLFLVDRALRLNGQLAAREEAQRAILELEDPDCDGRDVWRALRRAARCLRAGRVCDDGNVHRCRRSRRMTAPYPLVGCDDGIQTPKPPVYPLRKVG